MPLIIYVGAVTAILYHTGLIQAFVQKIGFLMRISLGTTGIESVSLALNIFLSVVSIILIHYLYQNYLLPILSGRVVKAVG